MSDTNNATSEPTAAPSPAPTEPAPWAARNGSGHAADPAGADPAKFAQVRDPATGDVVLKPRAADGSVIDNVTVDPADGAATPGADSSPKVAIGDVEMSQDEWLAAAQAKTADDVRRASLPTDPNGYELALPADFQVPHGVQFTMDTNDPAFAQARTIAHEAGITQEQFSKLLGVYAGQLVGEQGKVQSARNAEIAKLGPSGAARIDSVTRFLVAHLGEQAGRTLASRMFTAADVQAMEKLASKFTNQGVGSFSQAHRDLDDRGKVDDATYDRMSYTEKKDYAARMSAQSNGRR